MFSINWQLFFANTDINVVCTLAKTLRKTQYSYSNVSQIGQMQGLCSLCKFNISHLVLQTSFPLDVCWQQPFVLPKQLHNYWNHTSWLCYIWRVACWGDVVPGWKAHKIPNL